MQKKYDVVIIGAGFAGIVMAERFAAVSDKKVLLIEQNPQVGGHCRDYTNKQGILIHEHGPHIFHTWNRGTWDYLSSFTTWYPYHHEVRASVDKKLLPLPFNLNSLDMAFSSQKSEHIKKTLSSLYRPESRIPVLELKSNPDKEIRGLGDFIYENIFLNYTIKQWGGKKPEELPSSITSRVPFVFSRDNSYFPDPYQGMPMKGYSELFRRMLKNKNIHLTTGENALESVSINNHSIKLNGKSFSGILIYTGMVDELLGFRYGRLPYRSLDLKFEDIEFNQFQNYGVINFPNENHFTRITEFKHFQDREISDGFTTICREYPAEYIPGSNDPYYIIPEEQKMKSLQQYREDLQNIPNLFAVGRLAEYRYYNMDEVVSRSLQLFREISE